MAKVPEETRLQRLDRIMLLLRRHPAGLTELEIAQELQFERRSTNNYLHDLESRGQVYKDGRYWCPLSTREILIRRLELAPEEAMTLYLAARLLVKQSDQRNETAETMLYKLAEVLTEDVGVSDSILEAAGELANRPKVKGYEDIFRSIMQAYIYRKKVQLTYQPFNGNPFETTFSPYLLEPSAIGYATYAIGYSEIVSNIRTYKLERITRAQLLRDEYDIPNDFPGLSLLNNAWSIFYGDKLTRVVLRFSPEVANRVQETRWHPSQTLSWDEDKPGYLQMSIEVAQTTDLMPWIWGWGPACEVVAPDTLRDVMTGETRRMAHLYGWSTSVATNHGNDADHSRFGDIFGR